MMLLAVSALAVSGADGQKSNVKNAVKMEMKNQTHCPVMGGKIDSTVFTDIQGQRVYHCCPMCSNKLTADPDMYFEKAAADGIHFENIQTTCPVSGKALKDTTISLEHAGRHLLFCSETCRTEFEKRPQEVLKDMMAPKESGKKTEPGHSGHKH